MRTQDEISQLKKGSLPIGEDFNMDILMPDVDVSLTYDRDSDFSTYSDKSNSQYASKE